MASPDKKAQLASIEEKMSNLLQTLETLDRWHEAMEELLKYNSRIERQNVEFGRLIERFTMVSFNARIEAASAGKEGSAFGVVADEVGILAREANELSKKFRNSIEKNSVNTTTTFQDIQAGGRMIMTTVRTLNIEIKELFSDLE